MQIPLMGGANIRRSPIAGAERSINLYSERNSKKPDDGLSDTLYQRPGLLPLVKDPLGGEVRGMYWASNGEFFAVIGNRLQLLTLTGDVWGLSTVGLLGTSAGPVRMSDNRTDMIVMDGTAQSYVLHLIPGAFDLFVDPTGSFQGGLFVGYLDGYSLFTIPGTNRFISSLNNELVFDPTWIAATNGDPGDLIALAVLRRHLYLLGQFKSEIWFDAGNPGFPFAALPYAFVEYGCMAPATVAAHDTYLYWLGQSREGVALVLRLKNYTVESVGDPTIETRLQHLIDASVPLRFARAFIFHFGGHAFYVLHLPGETWVFDEGQNAWHQWSTGTGPWRASCHGIFYQLNLFGDAADGTIYTGSWLTQSDGANSIKFTRGFPHLALAMSWQGQPIPTDGRRLQVTRFAANFDTGHTLVEGATLTLRYSSDRGNTWGSDLMHSAGSPGEYQVQPMWRMLGTARDFVFELEWEFMGQGALLGAWVDVEILPDT